MGLALSNSFVFLPIMNDDIPQENNHDMHNILEQSKAIHVQSVQSKEHVLLDEKSLQDNGTILAQDNYLARNSLQIYNIVTLQNLESEFHKE